MTLRLEHQDALDLVIRGGRVLDPGMGIDARLDVGVRYGRVVALEPDLSPRIAGRRTVMPWDLGTTVIDATDRIVAPGFVDLHTHVYVGGGTLSVPADETSATSGVTTVVSAGDAGAHTIGAFRRLIVQGSRTRVFAFLNVSTVGVAPWPAGEAIDLAMLDVHAGIRAVRENRDIVLGVKVRMTQPEVTGENGLEPLRRAVAIADATGIPVMMHLGDGMWRIGDLLALLRPGDIATHCFTGCINTLVQDGRLVPEAIEARRRGILFDVGHGAGAFVYRTADVAMGEGFWPDSISTDLHTLSVNGAMVDLPTTMSKFLALGMSLNEVLARVTSRPAAAIGLSSTVGAIELGRSADLAVFDIEDAPQVFRDTDGVERAATQRIRVRHTIRGGIPWFRPLPYPGRGPALHTD